MRLNFFKLLADNFSTDIVRQILRDGRLKLYKEGQIVTYMGKKMKYVRVLLNGEVLVIDKEEEDENEIGLW